MATDIVITDVTNGSLDTNNDWVGTGVFDVLMHAVNKNIDGQYLKGRITGSDYANVYLGAMQAVLAQSVDYVMKEKVSEAQVDNMIADTGFRDREVTVTELNGEKQRLVMEKEIELQSYELTNIKPKELALKEKELELKSIEATRVKDMTEAELEKQWGYTVTRNVDGELVLGSTTGTGAIDKDLELKSKQITAIDKDIVLKEAQKALVYTETIGKDKEVAMMGMDNVMKLREASKTDNTNYVYIPAYKEMV